MKIADLASRIDAGEQWMDAIEERVDASFALLSSQILQSRRETTDAILAIQTDFSGVIATVRRVYGAVKTDPEVHAPNTTASAPCARPLSL